MSQSESTCTLEGFINYKDIDSNIYYSNLSIFEKSIDGESLLLSYNVLNDYIDEIMDMTVTVTLTDEEYIKYQYNPKLLAYTLYGSTEYYYIILFVNSMASVKEFNKRKIKLLRPKDLSEVLSSIYSSEESFISKARELIEE